MFRYFLTGLGTRVLEFKTLISRLVIFFIEVLIDLEFEKIRYCVGDEVCHDMLDCKVIQTKWLLRIATYTLNDCMFKFVAI